MAQWITQRIVHPGLLSCTLLVAIGNGSGALEDGQGTVCAAVQATLRVCKLETFSCIEPKSKQALQR